MKDLIIRGDAAKLEALLREVEATVGREARVQPMTSAQAGEMREPVLIALIVALAGPPVVGAVVAAIKQLRDDDAEGEPKADLELALVDDDGADEDEEPIGLHVLEEMVYDP